MFIRANAKINLYLEIVGKRDDGYHNIETVFHSIDLFDTIRLTETNGVDLFCDLPHLPINSRNIAYRAAEKLIERFPKIPGIRIELTKQIPIAAGLGGGSADAAGVLIGMNDLYQLDLPLSELITIGAEIGADVPFCLMGGCAIGRGRGDQLTQIDPLDDLPIVIANPGIRISTAEVFKNLAFPLTTEKRDDIILDRDLLKGEVSYLIDRLHNRLETVVFPHYPEIKNLKRMIGHADGSLGALMSGSGSTLFGIMRSKSDADRFASQLDLPVAISTTTHRKGIEIN